MKAAAIKAIVLDASVTLAWCFPGESTSYTEAILDLLGAGSNALAPSIWPFEVANGLLMGERRKRLTMAQVVSILQRISDLPITIEAARIDRLFGDVLSVARQQQLTEYDAAYLEVALREGLPLASLDDRLRRAALDVGVQLVSI
jgi:predicted nucleic acid-binding protein